jgi:hypothetical protein
MSQVMVDMGMSLDGCVAGPNAGPHNPLGNGGMLIHQWIYDLKPWRERQGFAGEGARVFLAGRTPVKLDGVVERRRGSGRIGRCRGGHAPSARRPQTRRKLP